MKVDLSPEAVTARLKTLDELWLLSIKLMNSRKVKPGEKSVLQQKEQTSEVIRNDKLGLKRK